MNGKVNRKVVMTDYVNKVNELLINTGNQIELKKISHNHYYLLVNGERVNYEEVGSQVLMRVLRILMFIAINMKKVK